MARIGERGLLRALGQGWVLVLLGLVIVTSTSSAYAASHAGAKTVAKTWSISQNGTILQIGFGSSKNSPQYAALHLNSSYFRMINSTSAGWGTSAILLPALWSKASCPTDYCQGAPVTATWRTQGTDLVLSIRGTIATLKVAVTATLTPPANGTLVAQVSTKVTGAVTLDPGRPGEAFKPVMLSSMHESPSTWDSQAAFTGTHAYTFPSNGWIVHPPVTTKDFGLQGGTSGWKRNAPTIEIAQNQNCLVTGWLTPSTNPNDDNVGLWCATTKVLPSWSYSLTAEAGNNL
jgi:hypothetical protein